MGLFSSTPEEVLAKQNAKKLEAQRQAQAAFLVSPPGRARTARRSGAKIFQVDIALSQTVGSTIPLIAAVATSTPTSTSAGVIERIEAEGWKLENVGYVYRVTGSVSRDKFLSSGQEEAMHGQIVGIYLFRATDEVLHATESEGAQTSLAERVDS